MYLVVSLDFGGNTDVAIHCCTVDGLKAFKTYDLVCERYENYNKEFEENGLKKLVELMKLPDEFESIDGVVAFWGHNLIPGSERLASNNT